MPLQRKDGTIFYADISSAPIGFGGKKYLLGIFRDITERKRAEEEKNQLGDQLRQAQKMEAIGQLAGGVAHDFNNILGIIMGFSELSKRSVNSDPKLISYLDKIIAASAKAAELTRQMLTFARKGHVSRRSLDIHQSIANVIGLLKHTLDRRIGIKNDFSADSPVIQGDTVQLENALMNIAINARDAMPEGGTLTFATANMTITEAALPAGIPDIIAGRYLRITISDTGTGMDAETKKRLFEPFFTTKEPGKGTGLGLAAVYGSMQQHNGYIAVESELGRGTTFILYLPQEEKTELVPQPENLGSAKGEGNILIIDDEADIGESVSELLGHHGYTARFFSDAAQGLEYFRQNHGSVSAVILDLNMPRISGLDCYRALKKIDPAVRVVIATGYTDERFTKALTLEGAQVFLQKPFTTADLTSALARARA